MSSKKQLKQELWEAYRNLDDAAFESWLDEAVSRIPDETSSLPRLEAVLRDIETEPKATDDRGSDWQQGRQEAAERIRAALRAGSPGLAEKSPAERNDKHDAGIIRDLEAMAANKIAGFWPQALAVGALRLIKQRGAQKTRDECPHCQGTGTVRASETSLIQCEFCWGKGQLSSDDPRSVCQCPLENSGWPRHEPDCPALKVNQP